MVLLAEVTSVETGERSPHRVGNFYGATLTAAVAAAGLAFIREFYVPCAEVFRSESCLSVFMVDSLLKV